jgi:integrase
MPQQAAFQSQQPTDQPQQPTGQAGHPPLQVVGGITSQQSPADPFNLQRIPQPLSRPVASAQPYPLDALGPVIEHAARAIEELVQAPAAICAQSVLAACAYTAQQQIDVVMPTGSRKPVSVFFLTVGASGERKSAVDDHAMMPLARHQKALQQQYQAEMRVFRSAKNGKDEGQGRPINPTILVQEPTFEGLCRLLAEGLPNVALMSDEGGAFLNSHAMNGDNKIRTATGLSSLWDGRPISRPRASQSNETLFGRRVGLHLMVQPDIARSLTTDAALRDQGLLSRLLVAMPETKQGMRLWRDPSQDAASLLRQYSSRLEELLNEPLPLEKGERNVLDPRAVRLDQDAQEAFKAFYNDIEREVAPGKRLAAVAGLANKAPEHAARLAAVQTYIADPTAYHIGVEAFDRAVALVRYYLDEALRLTAFAPLDHGVALAEMTRDWLIARGKPLIHLAELYQFGPNAVRTKATAIKAMAVLEAHDWVIRLPAGTKIGGVGRKVGIPFARGKACPVLALDAWLNVSGITEGSLFRPVNRHGHVGDVRLSGEAVAIVVKERAEAVGLDPNRYSGHSLRAGLATSAATAGVASWKIRQQTGHTSDAMLGRYIRDGELFRDNAAGAIL